MTLEQARKLRRAIEIASASHNDTIAAEVPELFPPWQADTEYELGQRVQDGGVLYKVLLGHQSQATWRPADSPSLFARVVVIDDVILDWVQPDNANPYMRGDKVRHNGSVWESAIDNNVWEPGALGTDTLWILIE